MYYKTLICTWNILDDSHKILLGNCLIIFGITGLVLNIWLFIAFIRNQIVSSRSYLFILAFCIACIVRGILVVVFSSFSALLTRWLFGYTACQLFGFFKLTVGIFQMTLLAFMGIERYLSVGTMHKGEELSYKFYIISSVFCWIFAMTIASFPLVGYSGYIYDTTCTACELDWKLNDYYQKSFNISVIVLTAIIPILINCLFLYFATIKEKQFSKRKRYNQTDTTKAVGMTTILTYLFWIPRAILIAWIPYVKGKIPVALTVMAPLGAEVSVIIPVLTYLVYLPGLRHALIVALSKRN
ncbi:visual pigment-like receptor peropsin [Onthophagus taurus]|uniref:visual pigment-like receptor peropsin n=1 Tax=Onthophagus taurus TaxID=166361 RepID=UPI0039BE965F